MASIASNESLDGRSDLLAALSGTKTIIKSSNPSKDEEQFISQQKSKDLIGTVVAAAAAVGSPENNLSPLKQKSLFPSGKAEEKEEGGGNGRISAQTKNEEQTTATTKSKIVAIEAKTIAEKIEAKKAIIFTAAAAGGGGSSIPFPPLAIQPKISGAAAAVDPTPPPEIRRNKNGTPLCLGIKPDGEPCKMAVRKGLYCHHHLPTTKGQMEIMENDRKLAAALQAEEEKKRQEEEEEERKRLQQEEEEEKAKEKEKEASSSPQEEARGRAGLRDKKASYSPPKEVDSAQDGNLMPSNHKYLYQNIEGSTPDKDRKWIDFWLEAFSKETGNRYPKQDLPCAQENCEKRGILGAHIRIWGQSKESEKRVVFIIPSCSGHNNPNNTSWMFSRPSIPPVALRRPECLMAAVKDEGE